MSEGSVKPRRADEEWLCPNCGQTAFTVPVWEDPENYESGDPPSHIGCEACGQMEEL